jgi:glucan phosphoethanolaminetransferase (alkaline phosphatase superfamily)
VVFGSAHDLVASERLAVLALTAWSLAMAWVVCGSARRLLLVAWPLAALLPAYAYILARFGTVPGDALLMAALNTAPARSWEVIKSFGWSWLAAWLAISLAYGVLAWWLPAGLRARPETRKRWLAGLLMFAMVSIGARQALPQRLHWPSAFDSETASLVYPINVALSARRVWLNTSAPDPGVSIHGHAQSGWGDQPLTVVLVVGESVRPDHLSLYGYTRDTTPNLRGMSKDLLVFCDVGSTAHYTFVAVRNLVGMPTPQGTASMVQTFSEAGFRTAWLSNQEHSDLSDHADVFDHSENDYDFHLRRDTALLSPFESFLKQGGPRQFIALHMIGSHFPYEERYGSASTVFRPTLADVGAQGHPGAENKAAAINSYDNTVVELDTFLNRVLAALSKEDRPVLLLYTSDHGEDLFDDQRQRFMHALGEPSSWNPRVPLFVWTNAAYAKLNPSGLKALEEKRERRVGHRDVFPTLLELAGIDWDEHAAHPGLANSEWREHPRKLHGPSLAVQWDFDELLQREQGAGCKAPHAGQRQEASPQPEAGDKLRHRD